MSVLILGGFIFSGLEIPESITLGGEQTSTTHTLLGGARIVDAMGPAQRDLSWTGRFQGADAFIRASAIDAMRLAGQAVPLIIDASFYNVLIVNFEYDYQRFYQIPYHINCHVVTTPLSLAGALTSLASALASDLASATNLVSGLI